MFDANIPFKKYSKGIFEFSNSYSVSTTVNKLDNSIIKEYLDNSSDIQINLLNEKIMITELVRSKADSIENFSDNRLGYIKEILKIDEGYNELKELKKVLNKIKFKTDYFETEKGYGKVLFIKNLDFRNIEKIKELINLDAVISLHIRKIKSQDILNSCDEFEVSDEFKLTYTKVKEQLKASIEEENPLFLIDAEVLLVRENKDSLINDSQKIIIEGKKKGYKLETLYYQQKCGLNNVLPYGENFLSIENTTTMNNILTIGGEANVIN